MFESVIICTYTQARFQPSCDHIGGWSSWQRDQDQAPHVLHEGEQLSAGGGTGCRTYLPEGRAVVRPRATPTIAELLNC